MGGGGGVRGLVELIQSYVEAGVERCISRGYALLYDDWRCVAYLLAESGVTGVDPWALLEPSPLSATPGLAGLAGGDCVIVVPAPAIVATVRMGSPSHDGVVKALSRLTGYREEEARFEHLAVGREGDGCYTWHFWRAKGVPVERMAREIAEFIAGELRRNAREMARCGMCRGREGMFRERALTPEDGQGMQLTPR